MAAWLLAGCAASPTPRASTATRYQVAVSGQIHQHPEFWSAVFAGAEAAATEYNMQLTIAGPQQ